jgi:cobalamin biosynthesis Mg chelatase CobN
VNFFRSKLIALTVVAGLALLALGGVSLAASSGDSAAQAQSTPLERSGSDSPGSSDNPSDDNGTKGEFQSGSSPSSGTSPSSTTGQGSPASLPSTSNSAAKGAVAGSKAASLPFTGYLAIPVLLIGVAMLGTGLVLRRRAF